MRDLVVDDNRNSVVKNKDTGAAFTVVVDVDVDDDVVIVVDAEKGFCRVGDVINDENLSIAILISVILRFNCCCFANSCCSFLSSASNSRSASDSCANACTRTSFTY